MDHSGGDVLEAIIDVLPEEESLEIEFKTASDSLGKSIWSTISAFANTAGGWLILGVSENRESGRMAITGVKHPGRMIQQLHELMRDRTTISESVCGPHDIVAHRVGDRSIVVVRVPPAARQMRPVYVRDHPFRGTYVRRSEGDFLAQRREVEVMMREASDLAADRVILPEYRHDDLDAETFRRYRRRFQTENPDSPHNDLEDSRFLEAMGGFRGDPQTGQEGITVAGLLMFGTDQAIRSWRGRHMIDYRLIPGDPNTEATIDWDDRVVHEGNLFSAFDRIYPRLMSTLKRPFTVIDGIRQDQSPQHIAIREALVNLLVHADYSETASSLVLHFPAGYMFRNPGRSRVVDLDVVRRDEPDPRNPEVARMFRLIGFAEEAGSGIPRIRQKWRLLGYQPPKFRSEDGRNAFSAELRFVYLLSEDDLAWIANFDIELTENERLALLTCRHHKWVDNRTLSGLTGQHPADTSRVLVGLRNRELLQKVGNKRGARYRLGSALGTLELSNAELWNIRVESMEQTSDLDRDVRGDSVFEVTRSKDVEWQRLMEIAAPIRSTGRIAVSDRDRIAVALCAVRPLSLQDLSDLLGRKPAYLRNVMRDLVDRQMVEEALSPSRQRLFTSTSRKLDDQRTLGEISAH